MRNAEIDEAGGKGWSLKIHLNALYECKGLLGKQYSSFFLINNRRVFVWWFVCFLPQNDMEQNGELIVYIGICCSF